MIINAEDFNINLFSVFEPLKPPKGRRREKRKYLDCICAFDIETSTDKALQLNFMYVWQFQIDDLCTIIGRRWFQFKEMLQQISDRLADQDEYLVVYVHNLSYEFQYLKGIFDIGEHDVFASDLRRIIRFTALGNIEFRCSMMLSNMSLRQFTHTMHVDHEKQKAIDYEEEYFPWTELPEEVIKYSVYDVVGLVEAVKVKMSLEGDTLYTIPLTSTGYPRRDMKRAMQYYPHQKLRDMLPDLYVYDLLREAFRGGDTHANRYYAGKILENVVSADRTSSYPDVMCNCMFPMSPWTQLPATREVLKSEMDAGENALLIRIVLRNIRLKNAWNGDPYIPRDKCRKCFGARYDNGRILEAELIEITVTDIDFYIITKDYEFMDLDVIEIWKSKYDFLPECFVKVITNYYEQKTKLKGDPEKDLEYNKSKNKLNGLYGMICMDVLKRTIIFKDGALHMDMSEDREEVLKRAYNKAYSSYAWGVWTTAWARYRLWEGIQNVGHECYVYNDTDCVKYVDTPFITWNAYNRERIANSIYSGSMAADANGIIHYMGVYEPDGEYKRFITLGSKRYAYEDMDGGLHITVSGVAKAAGARELQKLENFRPGFLFRHSGKTASRYVDKPMTDRFTFWEDGHEQYVEITPYILIEETTYEMSLTDEYMDLLGILEN